MSSTVRKNAVIFTVAFVALICFALVGCSSGGASSPASSSSDSSESLSVQAEDSMLVLGEKTDTALNIVFTNDSGSTITNFAVLPAGSADQPTMLMKDGEEVADGEQVSVFTEPAADSLFDAVIVCGDAQYTLHDLNFGTMNEATIRLEGDVAYVEAMVAGSLVSSLQEEYDRVHPSAEESEAQAQEAAAEPVEEVQQAAEEPVRYEEPAAAEEAPAQSEDSCVSDVVLR